MNLKIAISAQYLTRYMEYAALCIHTLCTRGKVSPKDIILLVENETKESNSFRLITKKYPVNVLELSPNDILPQKYVASDEVFKEFPNVDALLRLDADTILTRDMDFLQIVRELNTGEDVLYYQDPTQALMQMEQRQSLMLPDFRNNVTQRLDVLIQGLFGCSLADFYKWLETQKWVYGGFHIVNRSFTQKRAWQIMKSLGTVCISDEVSVKFCEWAANKGSLDFVSKVLDDCSPNFKIATCPRDFDLNYQGGMIHYSGSWYRLEKPHIKALLVGAIDEALVEMSRS